MSGCDTPINYDYFLARPKETDLSRIKWLVHNCCEHPEDDPCETCEPPTEEPGEPEE